MDYLSDRIRFARIDTFGDGDLPRRLLSTSRVGIIHRLVGWIVRVFTGNPSMVIIQKETSLHSPLWSNFLEIIFFWLAVSDLLVALSIFDGSGWASKCGFGR